MWTRGLNPMRPTQLVPNKDFQSPTFWLKKRVIVVGKAGPNHNSVALFGIPFKHKHSQYTYSPIPTKPGWLLCTRWLWLATTVMSTHSSDPVWHSTQTPLKYSTQKRFSFFFFFFLFLFFVVVVTSKWKKKKKRQTLIRTLFTEILKKSFNHWNTDHVWKWVPVESSKLPVRRRVKKTTTRTDVPNLSRIFCDILLGVHGHALGTVWPQNLSALVWHSTLALFTVTGRGAVTSAHIDCTPERKARGDRKDKSRRADVLSRRNEN